ncbi:FecR domain-containing protein [Caulobacter sp. 1776]|uniref:FecR family protein n=1 Tax=Caulobacter sp. 1776 TaxID=3156420 RepID=UPI0033923E4F
MTPDSSSESDPRRILAASFTRALTEAEQAALDAWAAGSAEARAEIADTREAWLAVGLAAEDPTVRALRRSVRLSAGLDRPPVRAARPDRRWLVGGLTLMAAGLVAGAVLVERPRTEIFVAPPHEAARLTLADGSRVTLSPGGRLTARFSRRARSLALTEGDAFFDVSHDAHRPFTVAVGDRTLTVLGTRFNVAGGRRLTVSLAQGSLRVTKTGAPDVLLRPGERYVAAGAGGRAEAGDVLNDAAWTSGRLVFADISLGDAAERLSRAAGRKVILGDPSLAALRVSGSVRIERLDDVRAVLEAVLPVSTRLSRDGDLVISPAAGSSRHG